MMFPVPSWIYHKWEAEYKLGEGDEKHLGFIKVTEMTCVGKWTVPFMTFVANILQSALLLFHLSDLALDGPGMVNLRFRFPFGQVIVFQSVSPLAPMLTQVTHSVYATRFVPRFVAKFVISSLVQQVCL